MRLRASFAQDALPNRGSRESQPAMPTDSAGAQVNRPSSRSRPGGSALPATSTAASSNAGAELHTAAALLLQRGRVVGFGNLN